MRTAIIVDASGFVFGRCKLPGNDVPETLRPGHVNRLFIHICTTYSDEELYVENVRLVHDYPRFPINAPMIGDREARR